MIKIWGSKKRKFNENREEFRNFVDMGGNMQHASMA